MFEHPFSNPIFQDLSSDTLLHVNDDGNNTTGGEDGVVILIDLLHHHLSHLSLVSLKASLAVFQFLHVCQGSDVSPSWLCRWMDAAIVCLWLCSSAILHRCGNYISLVVVGNW
jgi:hypothetical protein